jgi:hypothetical protein
VDRADFNTAQLLHIESHVGDPSPSSAALEINPQKIP